eukprot:jgi/Botrbrau1/12268/Bobra.0323s0008.1
MAALKPATDFDLPPDLALKVAAAFLALISVIFWFQRRSALRTVPGIPVIGHVVSLAFQGAAFIHRCRIKNGDVFTLDLAGKKTFIFGTEAMAYFFTAPGDQLAFRPAVEQFTWRVSGLPSKHFFPRHEVMLRTLRELVGPDNLPDLAAHLLRHMRCRLSRLLSQTPLQDDLMEVIWEVLFGSAVSTLFGEPFMQRVGEETLRRHFHTFESGFELAASPLPHFLQPQFCRARTALLGALRHFPPGQCGGNCVEFFHIS